MQDYNTDELAELLGWPASRIRTLARDGLLTATRRGRAYRFGFRDIVLLRTAKTLIEQGVSYSKVRRSLQNLKRSLPDGRPLTAIRVRGLGRTVVIEERGRLWGADSGQGQLPLESGPRTEAVHYIDRTDSRLDQMFDEAIGFEDEQPGKAVKTYQQLIARDSDQFEAHINLGRLLQEQARLDDAASHYEKAIENECYGAVARFNLGTVREEQGDWAAAIEHYLEAAGGGVVDAHYNLARLYELQGNRARALKHLIHLARRRGV